MAEELEQILCCNCGKDITDEEDTRQEHGEDIYCEDCFDDLFFCCDDCGTYTDAGSITNIDDTYVCESCRDNEYFLCDDCGEYAHEDTRVVTVAGTDICATCYRCDYFTCQECGEVYHNDAYSSDGYCVNCVSPENENGLFGYSYKPDPDFYGKGDLFFGIELEIESEGNDIYEVVESLPEFVYAKADSTMEDGLEVVSHPTSWDWLQANKEMWGKILDLRNRGFLSYKTDTCGMHVHMSKKAFSTLHLYKFLKMFFENQSFITTVSRRKAHKLECYASLQSEESIVYKAASKGSETRYTAVNLQNEDTVEVRIFRGTLSPVGFWRNVEFCKAVYEFTKNASIKDITTDKFCDYVVEYQKEYPNLFSFLVDKDFVKHLFSSEVV